MNPFNNLTLEEQQNMIARSSSGECPIFSGEEASGPEIDTLRHAIHSGQFFEVEPAQLIDVAKHMTIAGDSAQKTIQRAYTLICEAHLTSRNIQHWNEKMRRGNVSDRIHRVVSNHEITEGKDKGKVPRLTVLGAFLKSKGQGGHKSNASKTFNTWVRESIRMASFSETIPWNPKRENFNKPLNEKLLEKGWIRWLNIGSSSHLILPETTTQPFTKSRRNAIVGEHITRPWWETENVWWPAPTKIEVKEFKAEFLIDNSKHFRSAYVAKKALEKFDRWLNIDEALKRKKVSKNQSSKRNLDTGEFE